MRKHPMLMDWILSIAKISVLSSMIYKFNTFLAKNLNINIEMYSLILFATAWL